MELGTENLGAVITDKDTPFFWSRAWHNAKYNPNGLKYDYPLLSTYEITNEMKDPFEKSRKTCYQFELAVLDTYKEEACKKLADPLIDCSARPINQIYLDTEQVLNSVLTFLGGCVLATTTNAKSETDSVPSIFYLPHLEQKKAQLPGFQFEILNNVGNSLRASNQTTRLTRVERPAQNIYGTKCLIQFCTTNCKSINYNETLPDYGTVAHNVGCC